MRLIQVIAARIDQIRAQVTTSALNALAIHLGSLGNETRKTLIVVSEGLPRVDRRRGLESLPTIDGVIRAANRSMVSIYAVDPRESIAVEGRETDSADGLPVLTAATDGQSIGSVADLSAAMRRMPSDKSATLPIDWPSVAAVNARRPSVASDEGSAAIDSRGSTA